MSPESKPVSYDLHYNEESDFFELVFAFQPGNCALEKVQEEVFVKREQQTGKAIGIWIYHFTKNWEKLRSVLKTLGVGLPLAVLPLEELERLRSAANDKRQQRVSHQGSDTESMQ